MLKVVASIASTPEHDALFSDIKSETAEADAELLEGKVKIPNSVL